MLKVGHPTSRTIPAVKNVIEVTRNDSGFGCSEGGITEYNRGSVKS
jgi:hypothetical protein